MNLRSRFKVITYATLAITLICAALLTLCFFLSFDGALGYFKEGAISSLFMAAYVVSVAFAIASPYIYIKCKKISVENQTASPFFKVLCAAVGAVSVIYAIYGAVLAFTAGKPSVYSLLSLLGALALGAYLICIAAAGGIEYSGAKLALLCASVLFPLGTTMRYLFVMYRPSNSVENILFAIFAVALLLYILNEGKRMISGVSSRAYTASLLLSLLSSLTLSVSYVAGYIGNKLSEADRFRDMLLCLALGIYFVCATISFISSAKEQEDAEPAQEAENASDDPPSTDSEPASSESDDAQ